MLIAANQNKPAGGHLAENIVHFIRVLREAGIPIGVNAAFDALDAAQAGPLRRREDFYWTLHSVFVKRREHHELFDQAFHIYWKRPKLLHKLMQMMLRQAPARPQEKKSSLRIAEALKNKAPATQKEERQEDLDVDASFSASTSEVLRKKDFEQMSVAEQAEAKRALARFRLTRPEVLTRRYSVAPGGTRIDLRQTLRKSLRNGGQLIDLERKERKWREPPLVVLCDISGSCSNYTRMFLHFLHAVSSDRMRLQVFLFGTRLTNITRELVRRDVDEAMVKVSSVVQDWSGGTRIGATLHEFNRHWARRVLGQGAHVLLMTDGLDREDVATLTHEMHRLRRSARRIVWLNPLLRFDGFEARAAGVRAMMPFVDEFRPVHSLDSLSDLAQTLSAPRSARHDPKRWMKHEHS